MATNVMREAATVARAWKHTRGGGAVVAILDEDVDVECHAAFIGRVLPAYAPLQANARDGASRRAHGVKVAGLALASGRELTGLAPEALLLPVAVPTLRRPSDVSPEANALRWAADHGADVICCAWAPRRPTAESGKLPPYTRDAIDHCLTNGRGGKGCVIVFSAGNDGSDLALNGYASHPGEIGRAHV